MIFWEERRMKFPKILILWVAFAVLVASAQEKEKAKETSGEKPMMDMPKPAPEMTKRDWMLGKWNVSETHEKSPFSPGGMGKGTSVVMLGPGGFSHVFSYSSVGPAGNFNGQGIIAWDPNARMHRGAWIDSMTPGLMTTECREEGADLVCSGESMMEGKKMATRSRTMSSKPSGWTEVTELSMDGGPWQRARTFEFKRGK
jgi:Protein of unknown function (DUF1579)